MKAKAIRAEESEPPSITLSFESGTPSLRVPVIGKSLNNEENEKIEAEKALKQAQIATDNAKTSRIRRESVPTAKTADPSSLRDFARLSVAEKWDDSQWPAFDSIVANESGWNTAAVNSRSGACGLGQALPCSKMADKSPEGQVRWVISYIEGRYGTPVAALAFWNKNHWY